MEGGSFTSKAQLFPYLTGQKIWEWLELFIFLKKGGARIMKTRWVYNCNITVNISKFITFHSMKSYIIK